MKKKSKVLTFFLSFFPGLGHIYLGLVKEGLRNFGIVCFVFLFIIIFLTILDSMLNMSNSGSFLKELVYDFISVIPWVIYLWTMADAFQKADQSIYPQGSVKNLGYYEEK